MRCAYDDCENEAVKPATGRPRKYCSKLCRQRAWRARKSSPIVIEPGTLVVSER